MLIRQLSAPGFPGIGAIYCAEHYTAARHSISLYRAKSFVAINATAKMKTDPTQTEEVNEVDVHTLISGAEAST
jgi:hypothetical protein